MKLSGKLLSMAAMAAMVSMSSCNNDDNDTPTPPARVEPITTTAVLLGAQANANPSFFSLTGGTEGRGRTYGGAEFEANQNTIDFSFAQVGTPTPEPRLISNDARQSLGLNNQIGNNRRTTFSSVQLTRAQFDTISNAYVLNAPSGSATSIVVSQDNAYSFRNQDGRKGVIYVTNYNPGGINATPPQFNGSVTIDVKANRP